MILDEQYLQDFLYFWLKDDEMFQLYLLQFFLIHLSNLYQNLIEQTNIR